MHGTETKEGFGMVTLNKLNPGERRGEGRGGEGKKKKETGSGRKLRVGYAKRKMGVVRFDQVKNLTFPVRGVQLVSRGPHGAQDGYDFSPTQNHKFT